MAGAAFAALAILSITALRAERLERVPDSSDPVLRATPLERQRIAPEPTPDLRMPPRPGRQTVVLQDYHAQVARSLGQSQTPLPPVVMYVPEAFFARTSPRPHEVWGINLSVRYPEMRPFPAHERACRGWCDGYVLLSLASTSRPHVVGRFRDLHADLVRQAAADDPSAVYAQREPPPGYTEAFDQILVKRRRPETFRFYARTNEAGEPLEFAECSPEMPSPSCTFTMPLDGLPQVEVQYSLSMAFWDQRDEVRAAVQRLVRSFLAE